MQPAQTTDIQSEKVFADGRGVPSPLVGRPDARGELGAQQPLQFLLHHTSFLIKESYVN